MKTSHVLVMLAIAILFVACAKQAETTLPSVPKTSGGIQAPSQPSASASGSVDLTLDLPTGKFNVAGMFDTATKLDISGRVMNSGTGNSGDFVVTIYANDEKITEIPMNLAAGKKQVFEYFWKPPAVGKYTFKVVIDSSSKVTESDEKNNVFEIPSVPITEPES